jgi:L-fuculose-phosphate aldolase
MVLEAAQQLLAKGLVVGVSGNVSMRLACGGLLAITPSQRFYDELGPEDIVVIDFEAEPVAGELPPSVESLLHIEVYRRRPEINAVIHSHSPFASTLAVIGLEIPPILEDQVIYLGGEIKLAPSPPPGTEDLSQQVLAALEGRNAALMANHGAVVLGLNLKEAIAACQLLEKTAQAYLWALSLGKVTTLSQEAIARGKAIFALRHHPPDAP